MAHPNTRPPPLRRAERSDEVVQLHDRAPAALPEGVELVLVLNPRLGRAGNDQVLLLGVCEDKTDLRQPAKIPQVIGDRLIHLTKRSHLCEELGQRDVGELFLFRRVGRRPREPAWRQGPAWRPSRGLSRSLRCPCKRRAAHCKNPFPRSVPERQARRPRSKRSRLPVAQGTGLSFPKNVNGIE